MEWDTVIGLEVHAQLRTQSKLFSGSPTLFGTEANSQTSFIDAGLPGVLPVLNFEAVKMAICFGLATQAEIHDGSIFERKNYFYPDLPKGYQISQFQKPIVTNGSLSITLSDGSEKTIHIVRAHLEEDAGKSLHESHRDYTGIDLNRAGIPLLEIVSAPCLDSAEEAILYLKALHQLLRFSGISDASMQEGSFRCDVNISLKPKGSSQLGTRTEIKNLNSFRFIERAIAYEQSRHQDLLERGQPLTQETRLYNPDTDSTAVMRNKENENEYRYFPDPDLLPITITDALLNDIKNTMPELPGMIRVNLMQVPELNQEDIHFLLSSPEAYLFYKKIKHLTKAPEKLIINWLKGSYAAGLNEQQLTFDTLPVSAELMAQLLTAINEQTISSHQGKTLFQKLWQGETNLDALIEQEQANTNVNQVMLEELINTVIQQNPDLVNEYRSGKEKILGFFVGRVMKLSKGQANPALINELLKRVL